VVNRTNSFSSRFSGCNTAHRYSLTRDGAPIATAIFKYSSYSNQVFRVVCDRHSLPKPKRSTYSHTDTKISLRHQFHNFCMTQIFIDMFSNCKIFNTNFCHMGFMLLQIVTEIAINSKFIQNKHIKLLQNKL
jgi:hypothetical protein